MHNEAEPEDCKILVVDDNVDAADTLVSLLGLLGFKAYAVYGGAEAILASEVMHPKLVFLDIDMPGMDGYQTATCLRLADAGPELELIALTARDTDAARTLSASVGFDRHVSKPIGPRQLRELAEQACPRR